MTTGVHDGRHHDLEQRVEARDRVFGGIRLGERGEVADIDEHNCHLAALTGEHIITLLKQPCRKRGRRRSRTPPEAVAAQPIPPACD